jgi:DNA-binding Lrp family transcriptional regulator
LWLSFHATKTQRNEKAQRKIVPLFKKKFQEEQTMINAIILINTERTKVNTVAEQLVSLQGISEVYSVSGRFDLVAIIKLPNADDLAQLMTEQVIKIEGITHTESMVAFKTFSKADIAGLFELGD